MRLRRPSPIRLFIGPAMGPWLFQYLYLVWERLPPPPPEDIAPLYALWHPTMDDSRISTGGVICGYTECAKNCILDDLYVTTFFTRSWHLWPERWIFSLYVRDDVDVCGQLGVRQVCASVSRRHHCCNIRFLYRCVYMKLYIWKLLVDIRRPLPCALSNVGWKHYHPICPHTVVTIYHRYFVYSGFKAYTFCTHG